MFFVYPAKKQAKNRCILFRILFQNIHCCEVKMTCALRIFQKNAGKAFFRQYHFFMRHMIDLMSCTQKMIEL